MSGVRPIKSNIQNALCEQAPNSILYIQFCMAELLQIIGNFNFFSFLLDFFIIPVYTIHCRYYIADAFLAAGCGSVWLERHLREVEAASSNLVTPIYLIIRKHRRITGSAVFFVL